MTFKNAVNTQHTTTLNGMDALVRTTSANVDLFYRIGASRGQDILPTFTAAYVENRDYALRIAQWARDIREGSGERTLFRQICRYLELVAPKDAARLIKHMAEIGRYDDLLIFKDKALKSQAYDLIHQALLEGNGLAAKWMPRKGVLASDLRKHFKLSPREYRKLLVGLTKVVETQMCANDWDNIDFSKVPSLAHARYKMAFDRHSETYQVYLERLVNKEDGVKVNAGAVYPYDVLKGLMTGSIKLDTNALMFIEQQWLALPNYIGDRKVLPLIDVSGSMCTPVSPSGIMAIEVAVGLGLYFADKNTGSFKDCFLTFSGEPELLNLKGSIIEKIHQMTSSTWGMNTDLNKALKLILQTAIDGQVKEEEMPEMLVIFSDMQFDRCVRFTAHRLIEKMYEDAGYKMPQIVFWNIKAYGNAPVRASRQGVALVSGFSPAIAKALLSDNLKEFTPEAIMLKTIMKPRYSLE